MNHYYLTITGNGIYDGTFLPEGAVDCSFEQYKNPSLWSIENNQIIPNPNILSNYKTSQNLILSASCASQIVSGFTSKAMGITLTYASAEVDQRNIMQSAQSSKGGLLSCQNEEGIWSRVPHTQLQSQQVLDDFVAARDATREKLNSYELKLKTATTVEEVLAVTWIF